MSDAALLMDNLSSAGISIECRGDQLVIDGPVNLVNADLIARLKDLKSQIIAHMRPGSTTWTKDDWLAYYEERAYVAEHGGSFSRPTAEQIAFESCIVAWLNRNPVRSSVGRCLGCGESEQALDKLLPFGTEPKGLAWLHSRCWPAWHAGRKAEAISALAAMGINEPSSSR